MRMKVILPRIINAGGKCGRTFATAAHDDTQSGPTHTLQEIMSLCKRRGIVFPSSDIYGSIGVGYDYGPIGAQLKRNVETAWWKDFVETRPQCFPFESAILLNPKTWQATGHVDTFTETFVRCNTCQASFRVEDVFQGEAGNTSSVREKLQKRDYQCPCGKKEAKGEEKGLSEPEDVGLLFSTQVGTRQDSTRAYLRPETAQGVYTQFANIATSLRTHLPFGIGQVGKSFRNEIRSSQFLFRSREFDQCELQWFCRAEEAGEWLAFWAQECENWLYEHGLSPEKLRRSQVIDEELAHYATSTTDLEFEFPFGWGEIWGISNRADFDLRRHSERSGKDLRYLDTENNNEKIYPYVIEPAAGVGRLMLAFLFNSYNNETVYGTEGKETTRTVLKLHSRLAPFKLAVLPLSKKEPLQSMAVGIHEELIKTTSTDYDSAASIGKRYRRQDEIGTPYTITVDFDSVYDGSVTVRDRDSMSQTRISIENLYEMTSRGFYAGDFQQLFQEVDER